jgi:hypothetical protein
VELQRRVKDLERQGLGLAVVTYDPVATLKRFATERGLTFPLLSDAGSAVIRRYGLLNSTVATDSPAFGVPFPGTFILDAKGVVTSRYFETAYQERNTVESILVREGRSVGSGPVVSASTAHLEVTAAVADGVVSPGSRTSLVLEVSPRPGMHVYAPGKHTYRVIRVSLDPQPWLRTQATRYPAAEIYHFKPLDERVEVFQRPFRLTQDVTILATPEAQKLLAGRKQLSLTGKLEYQACDDKICYAPAAVPLAWTVDLTPLARPQPPPGR